MSPELASILPYLLIAALIAVLAVWFLLRSSKSTDVIRDEQGPARDVLDEGARPAQRNQALIDAPQAVEKVFGETSAKANAHSIATAPESADAEAGASVTPTRDLPSPGDYGRAGTEPGPAEPAPAQPVSSRPAPSEPAAAPTGSAAPADDLSQIKGIGPKLVILLASLEITRFEQIAAWSEADVERIDGQLGRFKGRITRDQWIEQAKLLMAEDKSAFEARFGSN